MVSFYCRGCGGQPSVVRACAIAWIAGTVHGGRVAVASLDPRLRKEEQNVGQRLGIGPSLHVFSLFLIRPHGRLGDLLSVMEVFRR